MKTKQKIINFKEFKVLLVRKRIKNLYLNVLSPDGLVRVSSPYHLKESAIFDLIKKKEQWIRKHQNAIVKTKKEFSYLTGEKHLFLGKEYTLLVTSSLLTPKIEIKKDILLLFVRPTATKNEREVVIYNWYREQLYNFINEKKKRWEDEVGVSPCNWRIRKMKTRWGSCNTRAKRIWIALDIIKKEEFCIDYIMLHELIHFKERRHNKNFYSLLEKYCSNYKIAESILRKG